MFLISLFDKFKTLSVYFVEISRSNEQNQENKYSYHFTCIKEIIEKHSDFKSFRMQLKIELIDKKHDIIVFTKVL